MCSDWSITRWKLEHGLWVDELVCGSVSHCYDKVPESSYLQSERLGGSQPLGPLMDGRDENRWQIRRGRKGRKERGGRGR